MKIITSDEQLRRLIPHVLATVEGEASLYEKLTPFLETSEEWVKQHFVPDDIFDAIAESATTAETAEANSCDPSVARFCANFQILHRKNRTF